MGQLVTLMEAWESFQEEKPGGSLGDFGRWLAERDEAQRFTAQDPAFDPFRESKLSMQAGYLIGKLHQYLQVYTKPLMKAHRLHSMDDFGYLATISWHGSITKSKACAQMLQEITTGTDIIRRLVQLGYVKEQEDREDRRQKLLALTAKGKKTLASIYEGFGKIPDLLGELEGEQRKTLVEWLHSLDTWHEGVLKQQLKQKI